MINAIEMNNITMSFGNFKALDNVNFLVKENEVHALIGENGAGKSTLMSILFGLYNQTSGSISINNNIVNIDSPLVANELGIGMVHQHFKLVDDFTVLENIVMNSEDTRFGVVTYKEARKKVIEIMQKYKFNIDLNKKIKNCTVAEQQRTEILKMLYRDANILIFDEPTAVLSPTQIDEFLKAIKDLQKKGKTIIIITHKLDELKEVANRGTIIRRGKFIGVVDIKKIKQEKLAEMMVGTKVDQVYNKYTKIPEDHVLEIKSLTVNKIGKRGVKGLDNFSLKVNAGEIVAIAGVEGNGQSELINSISGLHPSKSGQILLRITKGRDKNSGKIIKKYENWRLNIIKKINNLKNKKTKNDKSKIKLANLQKEINNIETFTDFIDISKISIDQKYVYGMSHIPEDRHKYGLVLDMNLIDNTIIQDYYKWPFSNKGFINYKETRKYTNEIINNFDVRSSIGNKSLSRFLSGGNQQKFIVGRELSRNSSFIIIAQPTRGLDVGAINNIHSFIIKAKKANKAILLFSYELDEVMSLANRVVVLNSGRKVGELVGKEISRKKLGIMMAKRGGKSE